MIVARGVARPAGRTVAPRGLVVPAYFHPAVAGADWRALAGAGRCVRAVILNAADGPGASPELELTAAAAATRRPIYGYVDTDYGRRPLAEVHLDVERWRRWYPATGIFLDRVATGVHSLPWYERLVSFVRRRGPGVVVLNHGAYPHPGYAVVADAMVTFEGPYAAHQELEAPAWARALHADRFWHLVYDTPYRLMGEALEHAAAANVGTVLVTDRAGPNPWDGLPGYFAAEASAWAG
jgi:hypothetical protein